MNGIVAASANATRPARNVLITGARSSLHSTHRVLGGIVFVSGMPFGMIPSPSF